MQPFRKVRPVLVSLAIALAGCGGEEAGVEPCADRLTVQFIVFGEGDHVLEGTADGAAFRCTLFYSIENAGENPEDFAFGGDCTGPVRHLGDRRLGFDGAPASVEWTVTWTDVFDPTVQETRSGVLEPAYRDDGGCRFAEASLPSW